ncbi:MAG TPA: hypothetical protein VKQ71_07275, partial [Acidimicrobiales bacterium]|nr:hypothetical protein [Acidimicrobiales bacterium]
QVLGQEGIGTEMRFARDEETSAWYCNPGDLHGIRVEYTGEVVRAGVESWLRGETALEDVSSASP